MRNIYQDEWFNIKFSSFTKLDKNNIAEEKFYNSFYNVFFKRYDSYNDLAESYKYGQGLIADHIFDIIKNKKNVLSIGCGIGFIENNLVEKWIGENYYLFQPLYYYR